MDDRTQRKAWSDLTVSQQSAIVVGAIIQFSLLGFALADINRREPAQIRGSKAMWRAIVFVNFIGPIFWFLFGRR